MARTAYGVALIGNSKDRKWEKISSLLPKTACLLRSNPGNHAIAKPMISSAPFLLVILAFLALVKVRHHRHIGAKESSSFYVLTRNPRAFLRGRDLRVGRNASLRNMSCYVTLMWSQGWRDSRIGGVYNGLAADERSWLDE